MLRKKILIAFLMNKLFWELTRSDDFTINKIANLFAHENWTSQKRNQNPVKRLR